MVVAYASARLMVKNKEREMVEYIMKSLASSCHAQFLVALLTVAQKHSYTYVCGMSMDHKIAVGHLLETVWMSGSIPSELLMKALTLQLIPPMGITVGDQNTVQHIAQWLMNRKGGEMGRQPRASQGGGKRA